MIKRGSFMKNFYDLQQFLKTFGIIIYMKDRKHTLSMVEYEVRELRRIELISKEEFLRAMLIIKQEDVMQIEDMINACLAIKGQKKCPLYQDVIDTQIYGLTKEINLAVEIGCMSYKKGRDILASLEEKASAMYSSVDIESKAN